jgi:hypothetical protein
VTCPGRLLSHFLMASRWPASHDVTSGSVTIRLTAASPSWTTLGNPRSDINFTVEIEGTPAAGFSEVILPPAWADAIEYREGGEPNTVRKLPGRIHFGNLILMRGVTGSTDLYDW